MKVVQWITKILSIINGVNVEDVIMNIFQEHYHHDDMACIDTNTIVTSITRDYNFNDMDVAIGLTRLCSQGKLIQRYPDEFQVRRSMNG